MFVYLMFLPMEEIQKAIKSIIETLYRQSLILNAMSEGVGALMVVQHKMLDKCQEEECNHASTFYSKVDSKRVCDKHYAKSVVAHGEASEDDWVSSEASDEIRIIQDFISTRSSLMSSEDDLN